SSNHLLLAHEPAFVRLLDEVRRFTKTERQLSAPAKTSDIDVGRKSVTVLSVEIVSPLHAFASVDPELVLRQIDPLLESTFEIVEVEWRGDPGPRGGRRSCRFRHIPCEPASCRVRLPSRPHRQIQARAAVERQCARTRCARYRRSDRSVPRPWRYKANGGDGRRGPGRHAISTIAATWSRGHHRSDAGCSGRPAQCGAAIAIGSDQIRSR